MKQQGSPGSGAGHCVESESLESTLPRMAEVANRSRWRIWLLHRRLSKDCRKDFLALSSSSGEAPSSSTSVISANVTGCVLKRDCRGRLSLALPRAGALGRGRGWGNPSIAAARRCGGITVWHPLTSMCLSAIMIGFRNDFTASAGFQIVSKH